MSSSCCCQGAGEAPLELIDALEARNAHWKQKWTLPGMDLSIVGYSRAAYRTGFYIPELNIMLDAGPISSKNPDHIFITHNHMDHVAGLPFTLFRQGQEHTFDVHGPHEAEAHIKKYVTSMFELNALSTGFDPYDDMYRYHGYSKAESFRLRLRNKLLYEVTVVLCDHSVPTVSYCFSEVRTKLKGEYAGMTGQDIAKLKKSGVSITCEQTMPSFAFICDTSISILETYPTILQFPIIFIECTFLYPEEISNCEATKHIHWEHLYPYLLAHADKLFVLMHFSLRYEDNEILDFFEKEKREKGIQNLKVWAGQTDC